MHLCDIPTDVIHEVEIPTGLPLVFDFKSKCIKLLDDGQYTEDDPFLRYDFGKAPELLFLPHTMREALEYKKGQCRRHSNTFIIAFISTTFISSMVVLALYYLAYIY